MAQSKESKLVTESTEESKLNYENIVMMNITDITDDEIKEIREIYEKQAPILLSHETDLDYIRLLALGKHNNMPLIQNLSDTNDRLKIRFMNEEKKFNFQTKYKLLREMKKAKTKHAFALAPQQFHSRCLPEALLSHTLFHQNKLLMALQM